jgi:hypothetical protein
VAGVRDRHRGAAANNNARMRGSESTEHTRGIRHVRRGAGVDVPFGVGRSRGVLLLEAHVVEDRYGNAP